MAGKLLHSSWQGEFRSAIIVFLIVEVMDVTVLAAHIVPKVYPCQSNVTHQAPSSTQQMFPLQMLSNKFKSTGDHQFRLSFSTLCQEM